MTDNPAEAIERLEERRYQAMRTGDVAALADLFSEDLIYTHSNAERDGKRGYLSKVESGMFSFRQITVEDQVIKLIGDVAMVMGQMRADVVVSGVPKALNNRYLALWQREGSDWRLVAYAPTPMP